MRKTELLKILESAEIRLVCDFCLHELEECDCEGYRKTKYPKPYISLIHTDDTGEIHINIEKIDNKWIPKSVEKN